MRKKITILIILLMINIVFLIGIIRESYSKYIISENLNMNVIVDKTPPNVTITYYKKDEISKLVKTKLLSNFICYCENNIVENEIIDEIQNDINNELIENIIDCEEVNEIGNVTTEIEIINNEENENTLENNRLDVDEKNLDDVIETEDKKELAMMLTSASYNVGVGNENEFYNNFYNTNVNEIITNSNISLSSVYRLNHSIKITSGGKALQLLSGAYIVVPSGCTLTLDMIVIDGRQFRKL